MRRTPLFWQLFPALALLTVAPLMILLVHDRGALRDFFQQQTSAHLAASAALIGQSVQAPLERGQFDAVDALAKQFGKASGLRITVVLPDGKVVADSESNPARLESHRTRPEIAAALDSHAAAHEVRRSNTLGQDFLYLALPLLRNDKPWAVVRVATPLTAINLALGSFERRVAYSVAVAALAGLGLSWLVSRRISRPLETIAGGAGPLASGDLDRLLPVTGSQETASLAETVNQMAQRLAQLTQTGIVQAHEQEAILQSMDEGVLTLDQQGRVLEMNRAAAEMFQLDPQSARGRSVHEVLRKADVLRFADKVLASDASLQEDIVIFGKEKRFLTGSGSVLRNARDERIGALLVFCDVTELRRQSAGR